MHPDAVSCRDRWIPWTIIIFFVGFIGVLSLFAWIAFHTYTGEVTVNAYKKGLAYNTDIAKAQAQAEQGWKSMLDIAIHDKRIVITFNLRDASGRAISDAKVTAYIIRPTQEGKDQKITLNNQKGIYTGTADMPWKGVWDIRISATRGGQNYQQSKTVILQ